MRTLYYGLTSDELASLYWWYISGRSIKLFTDSYDSEGTGSAVAGGTYYLRVSGADGGDGYHYYYLLRWDTSLMRQYLGHCPILVSANFVVYAYGTQTQNFTVYIYRMSNPSTINLTTNICDSKWRDQNASLPWNGTMYAPRPGYDAILPAAGSYTTYNTTDKQKLTVDFRDEITHGLLSGGYVYWLLNNFAKNQNIGSSIYYALDNQYYPHFEITYLLPVESYQADVGTGEVDLGLPMHAENGSDSYRGYLGALQRGETGDPKKFFWVNFTDRTFKLRQIYDDYPSWEPIEKTTSGGAGNCFYITPSEAAKSQHWFFKVTNSATQFQVKGLRYRDYGVDLNSTYGTGGWTGTIGSNFTTPTGGITIPGSAWTLDGHVDGDIYETYVIGNSTDTAWPFDSNDQVQITFDDSNAADTANWRPVCGKWYKTLASVTVSSSTRTFYVPPFTTSLIDVGTKAFIGHEDTSPIHLDGTVDSVTAGATNGTVTFTAGGGGVGNDLTIGGFFMGSSPADFDVKITTAGTPDKFKYQKNTGGWSAEFSCSTSYTKLEDGIYVKWGVNTGHVVDDLWEFTSTPYSITLSGLDTSGSPVYPAGSIVGTTLPVDTHAPADWEIINTTCGHGQTYEDRLYMDDTSDFTVSDYVFVQSATDASVFEEMQIDLIQPDEYIRCSTVLANSYPVNSFVAVVGSGATPYWLRAVVTVDTDEERKDLRIVYR